MRNKFDNPNVKLWYRWIIANETRNQACVIYFLSRRYSTSPRFFPLYNSFCKTDIILFRGSRFPGVDRIYLKFLPYFVKIFRRKLSMYANFIALNSDSNLVIPTNMILNLDDPTYTDTEILELVQWESKVFEFGFQPTIVCTSEYIREYLESNKLQSRLFVIPQGHSNSGDLQSISGFEKDGFKNFVYISPAIDVTGDQHEGHKMWDASPLLLDIWPKVSSKKARLHLIGKLGDRASLCLTDKRIQYHGLLSIEECSILLPSFDVALYPRIHDNGWLPQKLVEYIGAGLPILAFDLIDTKIVRDFNIGLLVNTSDEFAQTVDAISNGRVSLDEFRFNSIRKGPELSWHVLAIKFENLFY